MANLRNSANVEKVAHLANIGGDLNIGDVAKINSDSNIEIKIIKVTDEEDNKYNQDCVKQISFSNSKFERIFFQLLTFF